MSDFKDRMIEAIERGWTSEDRAYDFVRDSMADRADSDRKRRKEGEGDEEGAGAAGDPGSPDRG